MCQVCTVMFMLRSYVHKKNIYERPHNISHNGIFICRMDNPVFVQVCPLRIYFENPLKHQKLNSNTHTIFKFYVKK